MIEFDVKVTPSSSKLKRALSFFEKKKFFNQVISGFLQQEAEHLAQQTSKNILKGGKPPFPPPSPFTSAIRRASGQSTTLSPELIALAKNIVVQKKSDKHYVVTVDGSKRVMTRPGRAVRLQEIAGVIEEGRPGFTLSLDSPSSETGKTPRQWFWWLYLSGIIDNPVSPATTAVSISAAKGKYPFRNTFLEETKTSDRRLLKHLGQAVKKHGLGRLPGIGVFFK